MPKVGQEPIRRAALISATIAEIGRAGNLDVTVAQIAKRAGMSTALAHYYYTSKEALFLAAMRHLLSEFGATIRSSLRGKDDPRDRLDAIVETSLHADQFEPEVVGAWLVFYVQSQNSEAAARLLKIYARRMHSNLMHELRQLVAEVRAERIAEGIAALIDGTYIRHALSRKDFPIAPAELVRDYLDLQHLGAKPN